MQKLHPGCIMPLYQTPLSHTPSGGRVQDDRLSQLTLSPPRNPTSNLPPPLREALLPSLSPAASRVTNNPKI